ncbi:MAG TPA: glycosyltransferase family 39 protein [Chloroflexota bacterium]|nr:glycosyltransferase family 39 protein [Chloroflexota bacterium]
MIVGRGWRERIPNLGSATAATLMTVSLLALITAIGALLRFHHLGYESLWLDELGEATVASGPWQSLLPAVAHRAGDAPIDYLGVRIVTSILGHGTTATRAWSWACGVAAIPVIAWLCWEIFRSKSTALLAGLLLSVSTFHILYSQEARFYALAVLAGSLCLATFLAARRIGSRAVWIGFALSVGGALLSQYFLLVVPIAIGVANLPAPNVLRSRAEAVAAVTERLPLLLALGAGVAIFVPWFLFAAVGQVARHFPFQAMQLLDPAGYDSALLGVLAPTSGAGTASAQALVFARALEALAIIGIATPGTANRVGFRALVYTAVLTLPLAFITDFHSGYFFAPRQVIFILVPVLCLASNGCVTVIDFASRGPWALTRWVAVAALAVIVLLDSTGAIGAVTAKTRVKEDWRAATEVVAAGLCPNGRVFVDIGSGYAYGIGYYDPSLIPRIVQVDPVGNDPHALIEALEKAGVGPSDWLVLRGSATTRGQVNEALRWLQSRGYRYDWSFKLAVTTPPTTCRGTTRRIERFVAQLARGQHFH